MKGSLVRKIFFSLLLVLLLTALLQSFLISGLFGKSYYEFNVSDLKNRFEKSTEQYVPGNEESSDAALRQYRLDTGSPVMVFFGNEKYEIGDRDIFNEMNTLTVKLSGGGAVKIVMENTASSPNTMAPYFTYGRHIELHIVRLGTSNYYEPLILAVGDTSYSNRQSIREYQLSGDNIEKLDDYGTIQRFRYSTLEMTETNRRAQLIYKAVKDCLIRDGDAQNLILEQDQSNLTDEYGNSYMLLCTQRQIGGINYYFVTIQKVIVSGNELRYFNRYFILIYGILAVVLTIMSYALARRMSAPLIQLGGITQQIAQLNFSKRAEVRSDDELGRLASDINSMSDSLQAAIGQLEEETRKAQDNEQRMQSMLRNLAHEFKTPLGIISAYFEVIQQRIDEENQSYYFSVISKEIDNLTEMVNDTIELSRLDAGLWKYEPEATELTALIDSALTRFAPQLTDFDLEVQLTDMLVWADPSRITQVVINLLSNAFKYAGDKRKVGVITRPVDEDTAEIAIQNDGYVSPEDIERIWERFYRSDSAHSSWIPGDGLGLEIVQRILKTHGSHCKVIQENGMIRFSFTLARVKKASCGESPSEESDIKERSDA